MAPEFVLAVTLNEMAGKMFAVMALDPAAVCLSFKTTPEEFSSLIEQSGIIPAPYLARAKWVGLEREDAIGVRVPHRWTFTSDSVAAHIATRVGAEKLTVLKSTLPLSRPMSTSLETI